ncbi:MAG: zf-HC2 domain-containing protein [Armatimonadetes bacterium]|nr:zf-HC2 domain-containing protein [Armatimonadota bacterium]
MPEPFVCRLIQDDLTAYHGGWLKAARAEAVRRHLAACPACAAEAARDRALVRSLSEAPAETPVIPEWSRVLAERGRLRRNWSPFARPALGFSGALAAGVLALVVWTRLPGPVGQETGSEPADASVVSQVAVHNMVAAGSFSGDPNRDVLLMYSSPADGAGPR